MSFATSTAGEVSDSPDPVVRDAMSERRRRLAPTPVEARWLVVGPICVRRRRRRSCSSRSASRTSRMRARWHEVEDGVLWGARAEGVTALEVAPDSAGGAAGIEPATCCSRSTARRCRRRPTSSSTSIAAREGTRLAYTLLRLGTRQALEVSLAPAPRGGSMYFVLAAVGLFTLLVGASVRLRRPRDQATLHFFWLCVAFFGAFTSRSTVRSIGSTGSSTGATRWRWRCCRRCCCISRWCFPSGRRVAQPGALGRSSAADVCAGVGARRRRASSPSARGAADGRGRSRARSSCSIAPSRCTCSSASLAALVVLARAFRRDHVADRPPAAAVDRLGHGARRRAVRVRLRAAVGARRRSAAGAAAHRGSARPRAADLRVARSCATGCATSRSSSSAALAYTAFLARQRRALRRACCKLVGLRVRRRRAIRTTGSSRCWRRLVVVLLARPVKEAVQNALDRVFYRDRYDYRRALVGFARDLNSDLDVVRLSQRLVARIVETLVVDRMALMLADERAGDFRAIGDFGFAAAGAAAVADLVVRARGWTPATPSRSTIRSPPRGSPAEEVEFWRDAGHLLLRAVRLRGSRDRGAGARPQGNRRAVQQRGPRAADGGRRPGGDGDRERPAVPPAAPQGRGARPDARVQREHSRIARRRAGGVRRGRADRPLEPRARELLRRRARRRDRPAARRVFDAPFVEALRAARREHPDGATLFQRAADRAPARDGDDAAAAGQRDRGAAAESVGRRRRRRRARSC